MKFKDKYPDDKPGPDAPLRETGPHGGYWVYNSGRMFHCDTGMGGCGAPTSWKDISFGVEFPLCSDECAAAVDALVDQTLRDSSLKLQMEASQAAAAAPVAEEPAAEVEEAPASDGAAPSPQ